MPHPAVHVSLILALLCALAGCNTLAERSPLVSPTSAHTVTPSNGVSIPFETIATNDTVLPPELGEAPIAVSFVPEVAIAVDPEVLARGMWAALATSPDDAVSLQPYLAPEQTAALEELDYGEYVALALFGGISTPDGDRSIQSVATGEDAGLLVHVLHRVYGFGPPMTIYPSHLVRIARADVPFSLTSSTPISLIRTREVVEP